MLLFSILKKLTFPLISQPFNADVVWKDRSECLRRSVCAKEVMMATSLCVIFQCSLKNIWEEIIIIMIIIIYIWHYFYCYPIALHNDWNKHKVLDNLDRQEADQSSTLTAWPRRLPGLAFGEHTNYQRGEAVWIYFGNILCKHWREMNVSLSHGLTHPQNQDNIFYSPWLEKSSLLYLGVTVFETFFIFRQLNH